jgi:alkylation response protein AidB-like acyl-CoA dehydrogenase
MTVVPLNQIRSVHLNPDGTLSGQAGGVPFASVSQRIALVAQADAGLRVGLVPTAACDVTAADPIHSAWGDDVNFDGATPEPSAPLDDRAAAALRLRGALARAVQIAGAMERAVDLAVAYAEDRQQFGQPIRRFQAVRDHLVVAAREVAVARAAVQIAVDSVERRGDFTDPVVGSAVAAAKMLTSEVAFEVSARTHQVHAAMGATREYPLHFVTSLLAVWRDQFGDEQEWATVLGAEACAAPTVWDYVTQLEVAR